MLNLISPINFQVEGKEYSALGVTESSAKNKVAQKVFEDKETMLLLRMRNSSKWKLVSIVNGLHTVSFEVITLI